MNWRNRQNRFGAIDDFALLTLRDTPPTEDNLKRVAAEIYRALAELGHDPLDPCAVEGLHMAAFEIEDSYITVGLSKDEETIWCLHVQMRDVGFFIGTRNRRLAVVDRLNLHLHDALVARADLEGIEWFQERKLVPKHGTARPML
ncbi:MAG: hypothetical protein RL093_1673 [Pseudomonadota bacterium]